MITTRRLAFSIPFLILALPSASLAQTATYVPELAEKKEGDKPPEGWHTRLEIGATLSFNDNRNVVGQADGANLTFGYKLDAGADYRRGPHEWRNSFALGEALTRTPVVDEMVKSRDSLSLETIYLYHVVPWFGPFGRFALDTAVFKGKDVRAAPVTYAIARPEGTETLVRSQLPLTDPFQPLTLKESLGVFARLLEQEDVNLETRLGLGARQVLADDQLAVKDDEATADVVEVLELESYQQLGVELVATVWGELRDKTVSYKVGAEVMVPFVHSDLPPGDDRGAFELTNIDLLAKLGFKIAAWASVDYELKAIRQPQLLPGFQVQNNLLLNFGFKTVDGEMK